MGHLGGVVIGFRPVLGDLGEVQGSGALLRIGCCQEPGVAGDGYLKSFREGEQNAAGLPRAGRKLQHHAGQQRALLVTAVGPAPGSSTSLPGMTSAPAGVL